MKFNIVKISGDKNKIKQDVNTKPPHTSNWTKISVISGIVLAIIAVLTYLYK